MHHSPIAAVFACLVLAASTSFALPSGFTKSRTVSGLSKPTAMAFAPDGRLFVAERGTQAGGVGRVRVIKDGALLSTPFLSITVDNTSVGANERGLLGLALDPNFSSNGFVYVYYTTPTNPPRNRISRFTANGDTAVSGSETILLTLDALNAGNHNGGALHFGVDGKLYVGVGENGNASNSTNLGNHLGKLLRINSDGSAPSDNPFYNAGDGINARDRIWAYGLRNPFTFAVQPGTGRIFVNDVGQSSWEEINDIARGGDYGWRGGSSDGDATAWYRYDRATGKTIAGGTFYNPATALGNFSSYVGRYFFADYVSNWIRVINPSNKSVSVFEDSGLNGPIDLDVGPDGALYYANHGNGEIWRIASASTGTQSIVVSTNAFNVNEGTSGSFTVALGAQPTSNVTVNLARTRGDSSVSLSPSSLTFTPSNWQTPRAVTVTAAQDGDSLTKSAVITCSLSGVPSRNVVAHAVDDDITGPKAIIDLPLEGDTVRGTNAEYYGGSSQDGSTQRAEFYIDGTLAYTDVGPGHYHFNGSHVLWDTTRLSNGPHTLRMTIFDTTGRSGSHEIQVNVDNPSLPSPWATRDVGSVAAAGSVSHSDGRFTVEGSGNDVWGSADEFRFIHQTLSGDGEIRARVQSVENTHSWAKAGVMIRESLAANARHASVFVSASSGIAFQRRTATGGSSTHTAGGSAGAPYWVRLRRSGNTLTAFASSNGTSWTEIGSESIAMGSEVQIGLAVTSHADGTLATAVFDNVELGGTGLPSPWANQDVGGVSAAGSASEANGTFSVKASGADIWGSGDEFHFVYQLLSGDTDIRARLTSLQNTNAWAKAGVMIRESLAGNARHALMALSAANGAAFQRRTTTGGASEHTAGGSVNAPHWVRLRRAGNTLTGFTSSDGMSWTEVGSTSIAFGSQIYVGLAATSHADGTLTTATFDGVAFGGSGSAWSNGDIGAVAASGSTNESNGTFSIEASGADIWGSADEFHFAYQALSGDSEIVARVTGLENTNAWAKAGVMIRETLSANSKHALMALSATNGLAFQRRTTAGGSSEHTSGGSASAPRWVRLRRTGNTLTGSASSDGVTWTDVGSATIAMTSGVYVGLAVTSHADGTLATATFDNVRLNGIAAQDLAFEAEDEASPGAADGDDAQGDGPSSERARTPREDVAVGCGGASIAGHVPLGAPLSAILMVVTGLGFGLRRRKKR